MILGNWKADSTRQPRPWPHDYERAESFRNLRSAMKPLAGKSLIPTGPPWYGGTMSDTGELTSFLVSLGGLGLAAFFEVFLYFIFLLCALGFSRLAWQALT
jgi:hypothetical protein